MCVSLSLDTLGLRASVHCHLVVPFDGSLVFPRQVCQSRRRWALSLWDWRELGVRTTPNYITTIPSWFYLQDRRENDVISSIEMEHWRCNFAIRAFAWLGLFSKQGVWGCIALLSLSLSLSLSLLIPYTLSSRYACPCLYATYPHVLLRRVPIVPNPSLPSPLPTTTHIFLKEINCVHDPLKYNSGSSFFFILDALYSCCHPLPLCFP